MFEFLTDLQIYNLNSSRFAFNVQAQGIETNSDAFDVSLKRISNINRRIVAKDSNWISVKTVFFIFIVFKDYLQFFYTQIKTIENSKNSCLKFRTESTFDLQICKHAIQNLTNNS